MQRTDAAGNVGDHVGDDARGRRGAPRRARGRGRAAPTRADGSGCARCTAPACTSRRARRRKTIRPTPTPRSPTARGLPLAVVTADCAPLVLASDDAVGVVHAGHRGLAAGVIEAALATLRALGDGRDARVSRPVHPRRALRVRRRRSAAARRAVRSRAWRARTRGGHARVRPSGRDPRRARRASGVARSTTAESAPRTLAAYFSYRRDGATGRQATSPCCRERGRSDIAAQRRRGPRAHRGRGTRRRARSRDAITLVAVSKESRLDAVAAALAAGRVDFGENRAQELVPKAEALASTTRAARGTSSGGCNATRSAPPRRTSRCGSRSTGSSSRRRSRAARPAQRCSCRSTWPVRRKRVVARPTTRAALVDACRALGCRRRRADDRAARRGDPRPVFAQLREMADRPGRSTSARWG